FMKIFGFKLGLNYKKIPIKIIKKLSMHKRFWDSYK
ncbi:TPA: rhamnosyltransferase, partial [Klebsiella michiganensis]